MVLLVQPAWGGKTGPDVVPEGMSIIYDRAELRTVADRGSILNIIVETGKSMYGASDGSSRMHVESGQIRHGMHELSWRD